MNLMDSVVAAYLRKRGHVARGNVCGEFITHWFDLIYFYFNIWRLTNHVRYCILSIRFFSTRLKQSFDIQIIYVVEGFEKMIWWFRI